MQKYLDWAFYISLCIIGILAIFLHSSNTDKYFPLFLTHADEKYEVYQTYQRDFTNENLAAIHALNATKIDDDKYLITFFNAPFNNMNAKNKRDLYGLLFLPNQYSAQNNDATWDNIITNTKIWSVAKLLATQDSLIAQTSQYIRSISHPIFYRASERIFLFLNTHGMIKKITHKIHVFSASIAEIQDLFGLNTESKTIPFQSDEIIQHNSNTNTLFTFFRNFNLSGFGNFNYLLSGKILELYDGILPLREPVFSNEYNDTESEIQSKSLHRKSEFILPLAFQNQSSTSFFALLDSNLKLKNTIVTKNSLSLDQSSITQIPTDSLTDSYQCIVAYRSHSKEQDPKSLYFQTCQLDNGGLHFSSLEKSKNINHIDSMELATIGRFIVLLYTYKNSTKLQLALFDGEDFIPIKEIASQAKGKIITKTILANGSYGYIFYANNTQPTLYAVILNEDYLASFMSDTKQLKKQ